RGLERRDDALEARYLAKGVERLAVGYRHVARAPGVSQIRMLGSSSRIVEACGHRMGLHDLTLLVLHHCRARPMQDARPAAHGQRRAVPGRVQALAARLDADQLDFRVLDERGERPDRVGATA